MKNQNGKLIKLIKYEFIEIKHQFLTVQFFYKQTMVVEHDRTEIFIDGYLKDHKFSYDIFVVVQKNGYIWTENNI